jgi:hypothetical protein
MTNATMERELTQDAQAPTDSLLRSQLDQLKKVIESAPESPVLSDLIRLRNQTRNHLSALLLRDDDVFKKSLLNAHAEVLRGETPKGILTPSALDDLLGL